MENQPKLNSSKKLSRFWPNVSLSASALKAKLAPESRYFSGSRGACWGEMNLQQNPTSCRFTSLYFELALSVMALNRAQFRVDLDGNPLRRTGRAACCSCSSAARRSKARVQAQRASQQAKNAKPPPLQAAEDGARREGVSHVLRVRRKEGTETA